MSAAMLASAFVAALAGSLHCVGMCGGFAAVAAGAGDAPALEGRVRRRRWFPLAMYQAGRFVAYLSLGAAAGAIGSGVDVAAAAAGLADVAAVLAGATLVLLGGAALARFFGARLPRGPRFERLSRALARIHFVWSRRPPLGRAFVLGAVTSLLPCGFLWAFVLAAAGTASVADGLLLLAVFWAGTVPALTGAFAFASTIFVPLRRRLPLVAPVLLVLLGVSMLIWRAQLSPIPAQESGASVSASATPKRCH
jgi:hypothetical protein